MLHGKGWKAAYQIIKASGKKIEVDMKNAIEEKAIYLHLQTHLLRLNVKYFKIAIPDLEVGDIIDYNLRSTIDWDMKENGVGFTPFIFSLAEYVFNDVPAIPVVMANGMKVRFRRLMALRI